MSQVPTDIPKPSVRRLSMYLRRLESLRDEGVETISSGRLGESLGLSDAQVRKDLAYFGQFGRPGVGYKVTPLIGRLRTILGTDRITHTLLVGVGNIGRALANYGGFKPKGFDLVALADADPAKIGKKVGRLTIEPFDRIKKIVADQEIRLAIIAVPAPAAQQVADRLAEVGIRGILNFAPVQLRTPEGVAVHNLDVAVELEQLSFLANQ